MRNIFFSKMISSVTLITALLCANFLGTCAAGGEKTADLSIPAYSGSPSVEINDNKPEFIKDEITKVSFESYGELDDLGRCTPAMASIGKDLMPTKDRESISMVRPTGWDQEKYPGLVDSDPPYLYNRCHMIGFQLTGENANEQNLITGTRYFNVEGMLPYENEVADYIRSTGNHVMYRVTPVFEGNNLLCDGVKIEALSVEDGGKGISFNVFCYNVQPGVIIDYSDGSNKLDRNYKADQSQKTDEKGVSDNGSQNGKTTFTLEEFAATGGGDNTENVSRSASEKTYSYIGNWNSHVFHYPDCDSVKDMKEKNKVYFEDATRDEVIENGFKPCQRCAP
ncbi:DNA/RNA non-specific endonuclease [Butyrivibrio sp. WCD3002]|uniref:DNA/RNA non-specific endonuclease n=1 Tax=Butyrivibrio sp. WCD3002 TaxID=1280676 RepID=UPI00042824C3|nr:DNA/RNA non-specific endonuclease [Butyrivibrio sp. WCD3002]